MASRLKALGLALIVVLALSAVAASGAWAAPLFTAAGYPATIEAAASQEIGEEEEYFSTAGRKVECEEAHFEGTAEANSSTLTIEPAYTDHEESGECLAGALLETTVTENGCEYVLHALSKAEGGSYTVGVDLECPEEALLEIHVDTTCLVTVPSQSAEGTLTAVNDEGDFTLSGTINLQSTLHSKSALICGKQAGEHEVLSSYTINDPITFRGEEDDSCGIPVDIAISGE